MAKVTLSPCATWDPRSLQWLRSCNCSVPDSLHRGLCSANVQISDLGQHSGGFALPEAGAPSSSRKKLRRVPPPQPHRSFLRLPCKQNLLGARSTISFLKKY